VEIEPYWKITIGITLGICLIIFGLAFWINATEDYYSHLNEKTYEIESCQQYMDLGSIGDRDDCLQKRKLGGSFIGLGTAFLWGTIFTNKDYLLNLMKEKNLL